MIADNSLIVSQVLRQRGAQKKEAWTMATNPYGYNVVLWVLIVSQGERLGMVIEKSALHECRST